MRRTSSTRQKAAGRFVVGVAVVGLLAAACGSVDADEPGGGASLPITGGGGAGPVVVEVERTEPSPREDTRPGLTTFSDPLPELPEPTIDLSRLRSGGPPPDGILSISNPVFHAASSVDYLTPTSPVLAVEINGDARAYPIDVMVWHEIVNDTVGDVPVAVQYCPLCNSATVVDRRVEGRVLEFGVSGLLYNFSLVMYDRQTRTLWSHFASRPLYGALGEAELVDYPSTIVGFEEWRDAYPDGLVFSRDTGVDRPYGTNPYPGYDDVGADPFLFEGEVDGRYTAMTRMVDITSGAAATAFPLLELRAAGAIETELAGEPVVAFWVPGSASALDASDLSGGVDVGATGVFSPVVGDETLTFSAIDGVITDAETGSTWNIFGKAIDGELAGTHLDQVVHVDTFWFAWIAFHPDSSVASAAGD